MLVIWSKVLRATHLSDSNHPWICLEIKYHFRGQREKPLGKKALGKLALNKALRKMEEENEEIRGPLWASPERRGPRGVMERDHQSTAGLIPDSEEGEGDRAGLISEASSFRLSL